MNSKDELDNACPLLPKKQRLLSLRGHTDTDAILEARESSELAFVPE